MSYSELILPEGAAQEISQYLNSADEKVRAVISDFRSGKLTKMAGLSNEDSLEAYIMDALETIRTKTGEIASNSLGLENNAVVMTRTGARGSNVNLGQMSASLGPQSLRGKRISRGYSGRPLPHFKRNDLGPAARGFIKSSYMTGLSPTEFFYHAMGGRESLVDTAVRTQQSGYLQRRLIHALETLKIEYDGTVRDPYGNVVEFIYGGDGLDPSRSYHGRFPVDVVLKNLVASHKAKLGMRVPVSHLKEILDKKAAVIPPSLREELRRKILELGIEPEKIAGIIQGAVQKYEELAADPGESVGIIAAQSIGEPGTQMTLRTFHYAGVRETTVTTGLPRLMELLDARRVPKTATMKIHLLPEYGSKQRTVEKIAKKMPYTTIDDIASEITQQPVRLLVNITLSKEMMTERLVTANKILTELVTAGFKAALNGDNIQVKAKDAQDLETAIEKLKKTQVSGIVSIARVTVKQEGDEWVVDTEGSNLSEVLKIPEVDKTRVSTNNIHEVAEVIGIEGARLALIQEIKGTLDEQGLDVDSRHIELVASAMTTSGRIKQIGRHGLSGEKTSVLAKAAFERTIPTIVDGAVTGSVDYMKGMTERVLAGEEIKAGTGMIDVYVDLRKSLIQE